MKPTARLIQYLAGPIVDEQALISAVRNKQMQARRSNVFDIEPLPASIHSGRSTTCWRHRTSAT